jgi:hypothetical protein
VSVAVLSAGADPVDLIPGDVEAVRRDAEDLIAQAGDLEDVGACAARRLIPSWQGTAADGYAAQRVVEVERLGAVGQVYRWAAETLHAYAHVLAWAQRRAAAAITLYATATAAPASTGRIPNLVGQIQVAPPKQLDPFGRPVGGPLRPGGVDAAKVRAQATADLEAARAVVAQAEQAAAEAIDRLVEGMPDGRWHWDAFAAGAWDWLTDTVRFVAWDTNLIRGVIDPDGFARDAVAIWDSATGTYRLLTTDPLGAPDVLLNGQQRRDDPGRWWGGLAPDIALGVVGGAGTLSRAVSAARAGSRAAEVAAAGARVGERVTIGPTRFTAEELMTPTSGSGPVTFVFRADWDSAQTLNGVEHLDLANAARLDGDLSDIGRVSTQGELRDQASLAAARERARAELAGDPYGDMVAGHGPDTAWTNSPEPPFWQRQYSSPNHSFGAQVRRYPIGWQPTVFQGQLPDGTIIRGSFDWRPE